MACKGHNHVRFDARYAFIVERSAALGLRLRQAVLRTLCSRQNPGPWDRLSRPLYRAWNVQAPVGIRRFGLAHSYAPVDAHMARAVTREASVSRDLRGVSHVEWYQHLDHIGASQHEDISHAMQQHKMQIVQYPGPLLTSSPGLQKRHCSSVAQKIHVTVPQRSDDPTPIEAWGS